MIKCLIETSYLFLMPLLFLLLLLNPSRVEGLLFVPNRHTVASIPGDLVLGILVPVHERPSAKQAQTRTCGTVREQYGIQRVEAAFRTIDSINADPKILPNITLGIEIRDSCWHSPIALEQSIEFIRDAMAASEQSQVIQRSAPATSGAGAGPAASPNAPDQLVQGSNASAVCAPLLLRQQQSAATPSAAKKVKNIVGVVGPASSTDTVQVQNLLQLFNMPQVGYSATSRDLSNKNFFKYFLRVVPSDKLQAQVMIDLMLAHNWTYITVAYTEGSYGSSLMNAFRERAQEVGICFATLESMPPNADDAKFDELIEAIQKHPNARIVICMCEGRTVGRLFAGLKRKNVTNEYLVVGSDGWSDRFDVVEKQEEYALGGISIRIHSAYVQDFDDYYFSLNPFTNLRNPWFAEFWETRFQCNLDLGAGTSGALSGAPSGANSLSSLNNNNNKQNQRPFVRPAGAKVFNRSCTGRESLRNNHKQDAKMAFVQKSIITMALGLDSMQRAICGPQRPGLCPEMLPVNGSYLLQHLMNVSFSFLNEEVYFDEQGDPPGKYEILNFQRRRAHSTHSLDPNQQMGVELVPETDYSVFTATQNAINTSSTTQLRDSYSTLKVYWPSRINSAAAETSSGQRLRRQKQQQQVAAEQSPPASGYSSSNGYEYVHVGSWKSSDGLSLFNEIRFPQSSASSEPALVDQSAPDLLRPVEGNQVEGRNTNIMPKSVCSLPCARGHAKKIQSDSVKCCWVCVPCRPNEYLFDEFKCKACEKGWWPNLMQTGCNQIPIKYLDWRSMEGLTAISIAIFGLILTLTTAIVFIKHNETPVVKSSTKELSYMILFSMLLCYTNTFFLVAKPRKETCFVTRILPGFAFAMLYGALVTKTNRIARILAGSKKKIITRRPRFMSATAQVAITWIIVGLECLIIVFMLIREPADKMHDFPSDDRVVLVCNTTTMGIIAPLGFDFFLIAMCTLYAFKTRNVPENFNEAKFIGFTMYTTIVIWIAFVAIYLSSDHKVTTLCLSISFSALFALFLLFFPRCYIIIFKPEKNNRSFFTTTKNVRCHIGYQIGSAGAAAAAAAAAAASATTNTNSTIYTPTSANQLAYLSANNSLDYNDNQHLFYLTHQPESTDLPPTSTTGSRNVCLGPDAWRRKQRWLDKKAPSCGEESLGVGGENEPNGRDKFRSLVGAIFNAFGRRSRRKESDKASSIQQHLRAIRHAENLDRQTHFRRSQVQRLVQRFDSSLMQQQQQQLKVNNWPLIKTNSVRLLGSHAASKQPPAHIEDGERLLIALSQLIGAHQVWRLADMIKRFCEPRETSQQELLLSAEGLAEPESRQLAPLDLERQADRKVAISVLRFLIEVARSSMEELCGAGGGVKNKPPPLEEAEAEAEAKGKKNNTANNNNNNNMMEESNKSCRDTIILCKSSDKAALVRRENTSINKLANDNNISSNNNNLSLANQKRNQLDKDGQLAAGNNEDPIGRALSSIIGGKEQGNVPLLPLQCSNKATSINNNSDNARLTLANQSHLAATGANWAEKICSPRSSSGSAFVLQQQRKQPDNNNHHHQQQRQQEKHYASSQQNQHQPEETHLRAKGKGKSYDYEIRRANKKEDASNCTPFTCTRLASTDNKRLVVSGPDGSKLSGRASDDLLGASCAHCDDFTQGRSISSPEGVQLEGKLELAGSWRSANNRLKNDQVSHSAAPLNEDTERLISSTLGVYPAAAPGQPIKSGEKNISQSGQQQIVEAADQKRSRKRKECAANEPPAPPCQQRSRHQHQHKHRRHRHRHQHHNRAGSEERRALCACSPCSGQTCCTLIHGPPAPPRSASGGRTPNKRRSQGARPDGASCAQEETLFGDNCSRLMRARNELVTDNNNENEDEEDKL